MLLPIALSCLPYPFDQWWPKGNPFLRKVCLSEIRKKNEIRDREFAGMVWCIFVLQTRHAACGKEQGSTKFSKALGISSGYTTESLL